MWLFILAKFFSPQQTGAFFIFVLLTGALGFFQEVHAADGTTRDELERQIQKLEVEASVFDAELQKTQSESRTLGGELSTLDTEIKSRQLGIQRLTLIIKKAALEIQNKTLRIGNLTQKIEKNRRALGAGIFLMYLYDQDNSVVALLKHRSLSEFFFGIHNIERTESHVKEALNDFKDERIALQKEKDELEGFEEEQQDLRALQEVERRALAQKKQEKEEILKLTKGKEALFQKLLQLKKRDIATLRTQLFYLEKTGITAEDAIRYADLAAKRAGIRTPFLLALLEVETGKQFEDGVISVGTNVGTGNWKVDMYDCYIHLGRRSAAESEKNALFQITSNLGLDPDKLPVSRKPSYGCGGAMGPAQFLPTTWLRFSNRVAELTGHNPPNPWNVEDAFTAAAIFLADSGASSKTADGETRAAKTYISGNPRCSRYICRTYASRILALTRDIDKVL